ncbi:MAG: RecQ family ATP-dependent DNA helicase, partial [Chloroflexota bacterium]|nr:RecQ family ATP-dependent DNA helicase [Chloroflexota bacterium]
MLRRVRFRRHGTPHECRPDPGAHPCEKCCRDHCSRGPSLPDLRSRLFRYPGAETGPGRDPGPPRSWRPGRRHPRRRPAAIRPRVAALRSGGGDLGGPAGEDTLAILPTGGGKSAIYQIAGHMTPGATLVVSSLLAPRRDQVTALGHHAIGAAAEVNSTVSRSDREATFASLAAGELELLVLAPEQPGHDDVGSALAAATVSLVVVDEAHRVDEWGHDFRPDYLRLGSVIGATGHPTVLALTATAAAAAPVRDEIVEQLLLREPAIIVSAFDRPNITLAVETFVEGRDGPDAKREALVERVVATGDAGIVNCATRRPVNEVADVLVERGVEAAPYHAGMRTADRERTQTAFMDGDVRVIVATTAFGMGIDKADVRFVFHHDISDSVDSYYQEIGRAGRDGEPAGAVLFSQERDL